MDDFRILFLPSVPNEHIHRAWAHMLSHDAAGRKG